MDESNSEFNKILSTPDIRSHESYEDCVSMDTMQPCNAPDSGTCCASDNDTTNVHGETCRFDEAVDYASSMLGRVDCVSTNCTSKSNAPETDDHFRPCVSTNDATNTAEIGECLNDSVPTSEPHNKPESGECLANSVPRSDTQNSPESGKCLANSVSRNYTNNITPDTGKHGSAEQIAEDIHQIIIELTEFTYTDRELNGNVLIPLNMKLRYLQEKGMVTQRIISMINNIVKEHYVKKINWEEYHQIIDVLKKFSTLENSANDVNINAFEMKNTKTVKLLTKKKELTEEALFGFEEIDKGKDDIQRILAELTRIDIPGIVKTMKTLEELGLLSEILLYKLKNIGKDVAELAREITLQIKRMGPVIKEINRIVTEYNVNGKGNIVVYINCRNDASSDINESEKHPKKADEQSKGKICRSEHNTPLCVKCGWRNSWVKAFKKRGVYIKEAAGVNNKDIWVNSITES